MKDHAYADAHDGEYPSSGRGRKVEMQPLGPAVEKLPQHPLSSDDTDAK